MNKNYRISLLLLLVSSASFAQTNNLPVYYPHFTNEITATNKEKEELKERVASLIQVSPIDPNYAKSQNQLALNYFLLDQKEEAKAVLLNYISDVSQKPNIDVFMLYGSMLSDTAEYHQAALYLDKALALAPNSMLVVYNKALLHYRLGEQQQAINLLKQNIQQHPLHYASYNLLASIAVEDQQIGLASLLYLTILELNPFYSNSAEIIKFLGTNLGKKYNGKPKYTFSDQGDDLKELDEILKNEFAYHPQYKLRINPKEIYGRNIQVIFDYVGNHNGKGGFAETYLMPWMKEIKNDLVLENFAYYAVLSLETHMPKLFSKKKKDLLKYIKSPVYNKIAKTASSRIVDGVEVYHHLNNSLYGQLTSKMENEYLQNASVKNYLQDGSLYETFDLKDELKDGIYTLYTQDQKIHKQGVYNKNMLEGPYTINHLNGSRKETGIYVGDEVLGLNQLYSPLDHLDCVRTYIKDEKEIVFDGKYTCFYMDGTLKSEKSFSKGKLNGASKTYNELGDLVSHLNFIAGELDGTNIEYFPSGQVYREFKATKGKMELYKEYNENSKLVFENTYKNGVIETSTTYSSIFNSKQLSKTFENGILSKVAYFDKENNLFFEEFYKKGSLTHGLQYVRNSSTPTKISTNGVTFETKNLDGVVIYSATLKKGLLEGEFKRYNSFGFLTHTANLVHGEEQGLTTDFYIDGSVYKKIHKTDDESEGLTTTFTNNEITETAYYTAGALDGPQTHYYSNGKKSFEKFFKDGIQIGSEISYNQNGTPNFIEHFEEGVVVAFEILSPNDKQFYDLKNYTGALKYKRTPCRTNTVEYVNGVKHGTFTSATTEGVELVKTNYVKGVHHGQQTYKMPYNTLTKSSQLKGGVYEGISVYYDNIGNKEYQKQFTNDKLNGLVVEYYPSGGVKFQTNFTLGVEHGESQYFNQSGQLILAIGFENDMIKYFKTLGKDGVLSEPQLVKHGDFSIISTYSNGKTALEMHFKNYIKDKKFQIFEDNGLCSYAIEYVDGYINGVQNKYYRDGKILSTTTYNRGAMEGTSDFYDVNGDLLLQIPYRMDEIHGDIKKYNKNKLEKTYRYDSDILVEIL